MRTLLAVEHHDGADSFVNAALAAAQSLHLPPHDIQIAPMTLDPGWDGVFAHGSVMRDFAYQAAESGTRTVLTDRPADPPELGNLHLVEWAWHEGLGELAAQACEMAVGPIVLLTGPVFLPPQRKIQDEVIARCKRAGMEHWLRCMPLDSFSDTSKAQKISNDIRVRSPNPGVVITSAGSLGEEVARRMRDLDWLSFGLGRSAQGHVAKAVSDVEGVARYLLDALQQANPLPAVTNCGLGSGFLSIEKPESPV